MLKHQRFCSVSIIENWPRNPEDKTIPSSVRPSNRVIFSNRRSSIDTNDELLLRGTVKHLAEQIAYQLRQRRQIARKVTVEIHYTDGFRNARSGKFQTNDDFSVYQVCLNLFEQCNHRRNRIRSILIDTTHFIPFNLQLDIFITSNTKNQILSCALDRIRTKYGFSSIQPAISIIQQLQKYKSPL